MRKTMIFLSLILMIAGMGCAALSHIVTPAPVDHKAVAYVVEAGVADANEYEGYQNLEKALRLQNDVNIAHETNLFEIEQTLDRENLNFELHSGSTSHNTDLGMQREEHLFGPKGLATLALTLTGFGGFTGCLGLMRKRPGDVTKDEFNQAMNALGADTFEEIEAKNKQLFQLVSGVSEFMDTYKDTNDNKEAVMLKTLKSIFDKFQDSDTKEAVARIKISGVS